MTFEQISFIAVAETGASKDVSRKTATIPTSKESVVIVVECGDDDSSQEEEPEVLNMHRR